MKTDPTEAQAMLPSEVLDRAADEMQKRRKCRGILYRGDPHNPTAVCAAGAIEFVDGHQPGNERPWTKNGLRADTALALMVGDVEWWSDTHNKAEVVAGLRKAASMLRESGE